jgi:hypothetical protein
MSDICLMAPVGGKYSNISKADFDALLVSEITPQIAAQWLYNVKAFNFSFERTLYPSDPADLPEDLSGSFDAELYLDQFPEYPFPQDLKSNPPLEFYPQYSEEAQRLKPKVFNDRLYVLDNSPANINNYLRSFYCVKRLDKWYIGVESAIYSLTSNSISATMDSIIWSFSDIFRDSRPFDQTSTYTITETTY